ncbi:cytochrome c [uncultured Cohaesibacter sp.]|uniref:c-type cytochrome n=1 Tax=uncultured Cohaesibacter sp. TaxID=1002546 RepID=UPI00292D3374|nr:cytochrome c [uncultured Cohaesibacter sp.]
MAKRKRRLPFAKSRNSLLFMLVSIAILLLMIFNRSFFSDPDKAVLMGSLDGQQIRREGLRLYNANCLSCHGVNGRSTSFGPALTDAIYHKDSLSDQAFIQAVVYGAEQKQWTYGPMEPIKTLSQTEIAMILAYVRAEQEKLASAQN